MQVRQVVEFFGGKSKTAKALGLSRGAITNWDDIVPATAVPLVEQATKGRIKADPALYQRIAAKQSLRRSKAAKRRFRKRAS